MILRLFRGRADVERASDVAAVLNGRFLDLARQMPGLRSFAAGIRIDGSATRFVLASTWETVDDVARQTQGRLDASVAPLDDFMAIESVEHLELVTEPSPHHLAPPEAIVRVARMRISAGREEEFYRTVRAGLQEIAGTGLVAYHLGRRVEREHLAIAVSVWRSADALGSLVPPDSGAPLWQAEVEPLLDGFEVEHYDAVVARQA